VDVDTLLSFQIQSRLGFHYFPDTTHYRAQDLESWLPELKKMGASWLTLLAPAERAIPEAFIRGLLENDIQPILHFQLSPNGKNNPETLRTLFKSYARWGVNRVALFDRPNSRSQWRPSDWTQENLVERFLDQFIPLAELSIQEGLDPLFPPLEPGGDYWDLSFIRGAFRGLKRRGRSRLLERLGLGIYAWIGKRPLSWGLGGPEIWTGVMPYRMTENSQDQKGFRIFDWYLDIVKQELGSSLPTFLLRVGALPEDFLDSQGSPDLNMHAEVNLAVAKLVLDLTDKVQASEAISDEVLACCFWLLASDDQSSYNRQAWISADGNKLPVVQSFYRLSAQRYVIPPSVAQTIQVAKKTILKDVVTSSLEKKNSEWDEVIQPSTEIQKTSEKPLSHYVLLPLYAWGAGEWDLELIQPLLDHNHPTVGFSLTEARLASRVTVIGGEGAISPGAIDMLRNSGCIVERIQEDGTLVAS